MTPRPCHGVTVEREDQLWTAMVTGLPSGAFGATDTERLADLDAMVRDPIATLTAVSTDSFDLTRRYVQRPGDDTAALQRARHGPTSSAPPRPTTTPPAPRPRRRWPECAAWPRD